MKELYFYFKNSESIIYEGKLNYHLKDNCLNFKIDNDIYQVNIDKNIIIKKSSESITTVDIDKKTINISLVEYNLSYDLPINIIKFENSDKNFRLKYEGEEDNIFEFKIEY